MFINKVKIVILYLFLVSFFFFNIPLPLQAADDTDFEDFVYVRMSQEELDTVADNAVRLASLPGQEAALLLCIERIENMYKQMNQNYILAKIYSDLDADDPYWDGEMEYYTGLSAKYTDKILQVYHQIAASSYAGILKDHIGERIYQSALDYAPLTELQNTLIQKDTELSLQYELLYGKEYQTTVHDVAYSKEALIANRDAFTEEEYRQAYADLFRQKNKDLGDLYLELIENRKALADAFGYSSYIDYAYEQLYGRDYTVEDLKAYSEQVQKYLVPLRDELYRKLHTEHKDALLRLSSSDMSSKLSILRSNLGKFSPSFAESFDYMTEHHLYDISDNSEKAPGSYTAAIPGVDTAYLYLDPIGSKFDMETLIHEFGHFNQIYHMPQESWTYNDSNVDLAEVHSQGLEMLFLDCSDAIYGEDADAMQLYVLLNLVHSCIDGVKFNEFEQMVYESTDELDITTLNRYYHEVCVKYDGKILNNFSESEMLHPYIPAEENYDWINTHHLYHMPLYFISYSTSAAVVLELFEEHERSREDALRIYTDLVDSGFTKPFIETVTDAGLRDPIHEADFKNASFSIRFYAFKNIRSHGSKLKAVLFAAAATIVTIGIGNKKRKENKR